MFSLIPWKRKGGNEVEAFRRDLDDLWNRFFDDLPSGFEALKERRFLPKLDMSEKKDRVTVTIEAPGIDAKDIEVSLRNNVLTIKGERKREKEDKDESYHRMERYYGAFRRDVELPCEVVADKIQATYKHGVLTIELPKSDEARKEPIRVEIH